MVRSDLLIAGSNFIFSHISDNYKNFLNPKKKFLVIFRGINTEYFDSETIKQKDVDSVIGIGRNPLRPEPFSLNIEENSKYKYYAKHITYELDLLLELLDDYQPDCIVNFAAQGEGAVSWKHSWRFFETNSMALAKLCEELGKKKWLKRFIQIVNSKALIISELKVLKNNSNLEKFEIFFSTNKTENAVNCYINNNAELKKKVINKKIINLKISNLKKNRRYRLNCTYFDEKRNLFWYGKMIKITQESIIF